MARKRDMLAGAAGAALVGAGVGLVAGGPVGALVGGVAFAAAGAAGVVASSSGETRKKAVPELKPGRKLKKIKSEKLKVKSELGEGSFGIVYKGKYKGETVAIKVLHDQSADALVEFRREVEFIAQLSSPYLIKLRGACFEKGNYSIILEYMPKGSLHDVLENKKLDWSIRYKIAIKIGKGLKYLHKHGVVHGDIKSLNLLLDENYNIKIADFGTAKIRENTIGKTLVGPAEPQGSVRWMAPELMESKGWFGGGYEGKNTKLSDIYSYGRVLQELATRRIPFERSIPTNKAYIEKLKTDQLTNQLGDEIPKNKAKAARKLLPVIFMCCQHKPNARYQSIEEAIDKLETVKDKLGL